MGPGMSNAGCSGWEDILLDLDDENVRFWIAGREMVLLFEDEPAVRCPERRPIRDDANAGLSMIERGGVMIPRIVLGRPTPAASSARGTLRMQARVIEEHTEVVL